MFQQDLPMAHRLAMRTHLNVLILGPTGSGKTHLAHEIHCMSARHDGPFVTVNLATLSENLLEAELFGHERGAYTGAHNSRRGFLEKAHGGTVFLDEIGELPSRLQSRLLDFIQFKQITPVGSTISRHLDVRILAATQKNLETSVIEGSFREDLFHRLRVITIKLLPLKDRKAHFKHLLQELLKNTLAFEGETSSPLPYELSPDLQDLFNRYSWPGNIRELKNVIDYAKATAVNSVLQPSDMPEWFLEDVARENFFALCQSEGKLSPDLGELRLPLGINFNQTLKMFEKEYLSRALLRFQGRLGRTARATGINKTTLLRRLRSYQLPRGITTGA